MALPDAARCRLMLSASYGTDLAYVQMTQKGGLGLVEPSLALKLLSSAAMEGGGGASCPDLMERTAD